MIKQVTSVDFNKTTNMLVVGFNKGVFGLYEMPGCVNIHRLSVSNHSLNTASINNTGEWLALGSTRLGQLLVWEWQVRNSKSIVPCTYRTYSTVLTNVFIIYGTCKICSSWAAFSEWTVCVCVFVLFMSRYYIWYLSQLACRSELVSPPLFVCVYPINKMNSVSIMCTHSTCVSFNSNLSFICERTVWNVRTEAARPSIRYQHSGLFIGWSVHRHGWGRLKS